MSIHDDIIDFAADLKFGALMGLDLGTKTIGVAVTDTYKTVATPLETIKRSKFTKDAAALEAILQNRSIVGVVLGLPRNMDGSEGPRAQSTRAFARNLESESAAPRSSTTWPPHIYCKGCSIASPIWSAIHDCPRLDSQ